MRRNSEIAGYWGLSRWPGKLNYHLVDRGGRAVFCECMRGIRHGHREMSMCTNHRSKAHHFEQWCVKNRFQRNLERMAEARLSQQMECAEYLRQLTPDSDNWDEWKKRALCEMHFSELATSQPK